MLTHPAMFMGHDAGGGGGGGITLVANGSGTTSSTSATTSAIDTTGADFIVLAASWFYTFTPTISDSQGNTWTALTKRSNASGGNIQLFYCASPTTSASHTFSITYGGAIYPAICVAAFSGVHAAPFDQQNGNNVDGTSLATGSITPTENNELIVTGLIKGLTGSNSINSGFSIADQISYGPGAHMGCSLAYLIQGTAAAVNPTWSWTGSDTYCAAAIASFKEA